MTLNKLYGDQQGSVAVTVAIFMFVLIGFAAFVLDFGVYYNEASKLQNSLDSAVLAAVHDLPADSTASSAWAAAENEAIYYASLNNFEITSSDVQPIYKDNITTNKIIGIKATKSIVVNYNFAKVLGINSGTLTRTSSAGLVPASGIREAVPLSITYSSLESAIAAGAVTGLTIKSSSNATDIGIDNTDVSGWFGALRFEDSGASIYSDLLAYGYNGELYVGQILDMESGNMSGPTLEGFTTRYNLCKDGCTADNFAPNCPKLVYIPVVEVLSSKQVRIVSFAAFFLLECGGNGNNSYIKATYIKDVILPDSAAGKSGQDFGIYVGKLLN